MTIRRLFRLLGIGLILSGCSTQNLKIERISAVSFPPTEFIEVLREPPSRQYETIAVISASDVAGTPMTQVMANVVLEARSLGADAVIVENKSKMAPEEMTFNPAGGYYEPKPAQMVPSVKATAIKWRQNGADTQESLQP